MSCKPVIFSGPMVRAILDGRKTMTRRVLKPQPIPVLSWSDPPEHTYPVSTGWKRLPYVPGDVLWVREGWKPGAWRASGCVAVDYRASPENTHTPWCPHVASAAEMAVWAYEAIKNGATETGMGDLVWPAGKSPLRWRPSIHMPRWASRITLRVMGVKVERLQDISEDDAKAEGLACLSKDGGRVYKWGIPDRDGLPGNDDDGQHWQMWCIGHKPAFAALWNSIHGDDAWNANPFVAAITFEKEPRP